MSHRRKIAVIGLGNVGLVVIIRELESFGLSVQAHDPLAKAADARHEYGASEWSTDV